MKFNPDKSVDDNVFPLLKEGSYPFEVIEASDCVSKNGNDMIKLRLGIEFQGMKYMIYDYLLEAMPKKLNHFSKSVCLYKEYERGEILAQHCIGKIGLVEITQEPERPNPSGGMYPSKNAVNDYIKDPIDLQKSEDIKIQSLDDFSNELNDDIPF